MTDYIHVSDGGEVSFIPGEAIIRCRDCKYCEPIRSRRIDGLKCVANSESVSVELDGFCAWAEPREVAE